IAEQSYALAGISRPRSIHYVATNQARLDFVRLQGRQRGRSAVRGAIVLAAFGLHLTSFGQEQRIRSLRGPEDHRLVVIDGATFTMGSPPTERARRNDENQHHA